MTGWAPFTRMTFSPICTLSEDDPPIRASRLALVTVFQFLENLTDRQAADAIRSRLDWKYAATVSKYLTQALTTPSSASSGHGSSHWLLKSASKTQWWLCVSSMGGGIRTWTATNRLDPCIGQKSRAQPSRMRSRNSPPRFEYPVRRHP